VVDRDLTRLEQEIGRLMRIGVFLSALLLLVGLGLWAFERPSADGVMTAGIVLLMAIPITRIAASFIDALRRRDPLLGWATAIVLLVMAVTIALQILWTR
jgi:uncharacterized membrane protein